MLYSEYNKFLYKMFYMAHSLFVFKKYHYLLEINIEIFMKLHVHKMK